MWNRRLQLGAEAWWRQCLSVEGALKLTWSLSPSRTAKMIRACLLKVGEMLGDQSHLTRSSAYRDKTASIGADLIGGKLYSRFRRVHDITRFKAITYKLLILTREMFIEEMSLVFSLITTTNATVSEILQVTYRVVGRPRSLQKKAKK